MTDIPLVDLERSYEPIREELLAAVTEVFDSQQFVGGPVVRAFEEELADWLGVDHAVGVSSGSDALEAALLALDVGPGDEVVTSPFSFVSSAEAIRRVGAEPVFADIDPETYNLDPQAVARRVGPDTAAILPVHLFGQSAQMDAILEVADDRGLPVVEDAAQSLGARWDGEPVGTLGTVGCFSFYPTKNLGGFGDGGMVVTDDGRLAERLRRIAVHGRDDSGESVEIGGNFRLDSVQAAGLRVELPHLSDWNDERRRLADAYDAALEDLDGVRCPGRVERARHAFHLYCVRADDREAVAGRLDAEGIGHGVYYETPIHLQPAYRDLGYEAGSLPLAETAADELLALPIYPGLTDAELNRVTATVSSAIRDRA